jgi:hypothetical protein
MDDTPRPQARDDLAEGSDMSARREHVLNGTTRLCLLVAIGLALAVGSASAGGDHGGGGPFEPGAAGAGDPYFPLDGNGGYDVEHYFLDVDYDPGTGVLDGVATIEARATQNLSSFNLDLVGLTVESIKVNGRRADWSRDGQELTITPRKGLRDHRSFTTVVRYSGVPEPVVDAFGVSGVFATDDGMTIAGEPHVAATWFPANDHPTDKASFTFKVTVPRGLEAVANGELERKWRKHGRTTWLWHAKEPMATYLATVNVGDFDIRHYKVDGIRYWDAFDPDLFVKPEPRTGAQFAISQKGDLSYKRLTRTISVPAGGASLSFWITRDTEQDWDFVFVEAHTVGQDDWTTLPDANGHNAEDTGASCPFWHELHPFLAHYQTDNGDGTCSPEGGSGHWWAASGASGGYEQWQVDLSGYAGSDVEVSISYASDDFVQLPGVVVDDVDVSTGEGTTSFEDDGDTMDGWTVPGAPEGSEPNPNDWIVGTAADTPESTGDIAEASFARQPEIIAFESSIFGRYPWSASGGIVDDLDELSFALETQTRPVYAKGFFFDTVSGDSVIVHELAHQWYGDSLAVAAWQHIWLNEGFATYAEWLWAEREGFETPQEQFDDRYFGIPEDDPFWQVVIGDPGPDLLFDGAIYDRGAMTLQQLRVTVGDDAFFTILRKWAKRNAGGNVTTDEFIRLAERISHQQLDELFEAWLFTPGRPELPGAMAARGSATARSAAAGASLSGALWRYRARS